MKSSAQHISMTSFDELFQTEEEIADNAKEKVQEIPLAELHPFKNHPFRVLDDDSMNDMVESVKTYGVLSPALARPRAEGGYELVSGHRRKHASELAEKETMPVLVREMDDDEATIILVDSNIQRESLLPSEKAWAYKMKLDALKHQGARADLTSRQVGEKLNSKNSGEIIAENVGESYRQIQRFIRLTELIPELLQMVDDEKLPFNPAVELSYLTLDEQMQLLTLIQERAVIPSLEQSRSLKKRSQDGTLSSTVMSELLQRERPAPIKVTLKSDKLKHYFPKDYTQKQMEEIILSLLADWKAQNGETTYDDG